MKQFATPYSTINRARPVARPVPRPEPHGTTRSTVLLSLLLAPDGGVPTHRHGQGAPRTRSR
jgi:hypothetical protein